MTPHDALCAVQCAPIVALGFSQCSCCEGKPGGGRHEHPWRDSLVISSALRTATAAGPFLRVQRSISPPQRWLVVARRTVNVIYVHFLPSCPSCLSFPVLPIFPLFKAQADRGGLAGFMFLNLPNLPNPEEDSTRNGGNSKTTGPSPSGS